MAEVVTLEAAKRQELGKQAKKLRRQNFIPAVVYGRGIESAPISVPEGDFLKVFGKAGENTIIRLTEKGGQTRNVLVHDVSFHPRTGKVTHVDFYQVRMDEAVRVAIPLEFAGASPAVVNDGGILVKALQELEIESLPATIPEAIEVDISALRTFEDSIYVRDLKVPAGVKVLVDENMPVASVQPPRSEEELKALEEKPAAEVSEVVVETEEKKKEREAAQAAETATAGLPAQAGETTE